MEQQAALSLILLNLLYMTSMSRAPADPACHTTCGSLQVNYPFGTAAGCGSPPFQRYVTCSSTQLLLSTHTGSYPITSISYSTNTLTITPPSMSTCTSMQPSPSNFGLDWASPFQLGPSTFILLSCQPPTSSLTLRGTPICDSSYTHLCDSMYTCPSVIGLGLPLFPPTNTCCVYSPGSLDGKGELDLRGLKCGGYASVVSVGDYPTDPSRWEYGVAFKYSHGGVLESGDVDTKCKSCEMSEGVCGYDVAAASSDNSFLCVCKNGYNTTSDCHVYTPDQGLIWSSAPSSPPWKMWFGLLAGLIILTA